MKKISAICIAIVFYAGIHTAAAQCISGDCQNGNGTYKWDNGDMYVGDWVSGSRTGYGRYDWADGSYYVGDFKENMLDGNGAFYAQDGSSMIGTFANNNFIAEKPAKDPAQEGGKRADGADTSGTDAFFSKFADDLVADSLAKAEALRTATQLDFCAAVQTFVQAYPEEFKSLEGPKQVSALALSDSWYSNVMVKNSKEAGITSGFLSDIHSFYNILFEGTDFQEAKAAYDQYTELMKSCKVSCCSLVYDNYDYTGDNYSSAATTWLTFMLGEGQEAYSDMVIEIELSSQIVNKGWSVVLKIYHLRT